MTKQSLAEREIEVKSEKLQSLIEGISHWKEGGWLPKPAISNEMTSSSSKFIEELTHLPLKSDDFTLPNDGSDDAAGQGTWNYALSSFEEREEERTLENQLKCIQLQVWLEELQHLSSPSSSSSTTGDLPFPAAGEASLPAGNEVLTYAELVQEIKEQLKQRNDKKALLTNAAIQRERRKEVTKKLKEVDMDLDYYFRSGGEDGEPTNTSSDSGVLDILLNYSTKVSSPTLKVLEALLMKELEILKEITKLHSELQNGLTEFKKYPIHLRTEEYYKPFLDDIEGTTIKAEDKISPFTLLENVLSSLDSPLQTEPTSPITFHSLKELTPSNSKHLLPLQNQITSLQLRTQEIQLEFQRNLTDFYDHTASIVNECLEKCECRKCKEPKFNFLICKEFEEGVRERSGKLMSLNL